MVWLPDRKIQVINFSEPIRMGGRRMEDRWMLRVYGARGSCPASGTVNSGYGSHTSCTAVELGDTTVVFDAGSGLTRLGYELKNRVRSGRLDIFMSHLHMDHLIGLFGFPLFFDPGWEIHLYGARQKKKEFYLQLSQIICPPYWPVGIEDFTAKVQIHEIQEGSVVKCCDDASVKVGKGFHPNDSLLFRLEGNGKSVVYGLDCEVNNEMEKELTRFSKDADVLVYDATYMPEDMPDHVGWGHSDWKSGIRIGENASVKTLLMTHFAWEYPDEVLMEQEKMAMKESNRCIFAREGMNMQI